MKPNLHWLLPVFLVALGCGEGVVREPRHGDAGVASTDGADGGAAVASFAVTGLSVAPTAVDEGGQATLQVDLVSLGTAPLADGEVWISIQPPTGDARELKVGGVNLGAGERLSVTQDVPDLDAPGVWLLFASLHDGAGALLADGPEDGVSLTVDEVASCSPACEGATPDCDPSTKKCVCNDDSCPSGKTCDDSGACVAATCNPACSGETPSCNAATLTCSCTASSCGSGKTCTAGKCVATTVTDKRSLADIADAAGKVHKFAAANVRLPSYVTMGTTQVSMPSLLMLEVSAVLEIKNSQTAAIPYKAYAAPAAPKDDTTAGQLPEAEYVKIAGDVKSYMGANGKAPDFASQTSRGTQLGFTNLVYLSSKALEFWGTNKRLPSYVTLDIFSTAGSVTVNPNGWNDAGPYHFVYEDSNYKGWGEVTCGPASMEMLFSEFTGGTSKIGQDTIAGIAGTGPNGTGPDALVSAAVTAGNRISVPVTSRKSSFAAIGWTKVASLVKDPKKGVIFHIMTGGLPGWGGNFGHYVFPVGVNLATSTVRIADPIKGVHEYSFSAYQSAMGAISSANQLIIVEKR